MIQLNMFTLEAICQETSCQHSCTNSFGAWGKRVVLNATPWRSKDALVCRHQSQKEGWQSCHLSLSAAPLHKSRGPCSAGISQRPSIPGFLLLCSSCLQCKYIVEENDAVMPVRQLANCCDRKQNRSPLGGSGYSTDHRFGTEPSLRRNEWNAQQDLGSLIILWLLLTCGSKYIISCDSNLIFCGCAEKNRGEDIRRKVGSAKRQFVHDVVVPLKVISLLYERYNLWILHSFTDCSLDTRVSS